MQEDDVVEKKTHKWKAQRNSAIKALHKLGKTYSDISSIMKEHGTRIGITQIGSIVTGEY